MGLAFTLFSGLSLADLVLVRLSLPGDIRTETQFCRATHADRVARRPMGSV